jgi:hypothetical protein
MDCFHAGKVPVRIFFHVDYKPMAADGKALSRKVGKDDITGTVSSAHGTGYLPIPSSSIA